MYLIKITTYFIFCREPLPVGFKVVVTLRFLATGQNYEELSYQFLCGSNTICNFIPEVLSALLRVYGDQYLRMPNCSDDWMTIADGFNDKFDFPHCVGAIDGKHIEVKCPANTNSRFFNFKGNF